MRRLLVLVSALVLVDAMLYSALTPLLPRFAHEFHLAKAASGALVASYAAGALIGGIPGGRAAARLGPRRAVLVGLTLMGLASIGFALAGDFATLVLARVVQGAGSAFTWAGAFSWLMAGAPPGRRGAMIGRAMSAAVIGELLGPVIGVVTGALGRTAVFSGLSALAVLLAALTVQIDTDSSPEPVHVTLKSALGARRFTNGLWVLAVASMLVGILSVLAPLHLAVRGWSTVAIGATWLVGAALEACAGPYIGRLSDARGATALARLALIAGVPVSLALATGAGPAIYAPLIIAGAVSYGALFTPAFAIVSEGAESAGLAQGMAFGLLNAAWATGAMVGPAAAGAIAGTTGDAVPFLLAAAASLAAFALLRPSRALPLPRGSRV